MFQHPSGTKNPRIATLKKIKTTGSFYLPHAAPHVANSSAPKEIPQLTIFPMEERESKVTAPDWQIAALEGQFCFAPSKILWALAWLNSLGTAWLGKSSRCSEQPVHGSQ